MVIVGLGFHPGTAESKYRADRSRNFSLSKITMHGEEPYPSYGQGRISIVLILTIDLIHSPLSFASISYHKSFHNILRHPPNLIKHSTGLHAELDTTDLNTDVNKNLHI